MANNLIQIKRSLNTATPASLANGEFAFTSNGDVLYIGANGTIVPVAGRRVPGTLTANQALVANATSGIDKVIVANLVPTGIWANGAAGVGGQILTSNATGGVYWSSPTAGVAGTDTQVQFNDGGALAGDAGFTYNKTTDTVTLAGAVNVGANTIVNTSTVFVGNSTLNASATASLVQVSNSTSTANLTAATLTIGTSVVNSTAVASGANVYLTTTSLFAGNTTVNTTATSSLVQVANSTGNVQHTATSIIAQTNSTVNASMSASLLQVANSTGNVQYTATSIIAQTNSTVNASMSATQVQVANSTGIANLNAISLTLGGTVVNTTVVAIGANVVANTSTVLVGNSTVNTLTSAASISVANSTGNVQINPISMRVANSTVSAFIANTSQVTIAAGVPLSTNGSVGSAGQALFSNGATGSPYWAAVGDITSVTAGNGLTGGGTTGDVTLDVGAGAGIVVAADTVAVNPNNGIIANSFGVFVNANTSSGLIANSLGVHAKVSPTVILDGTGNLAVNSAALSFTDLTVSGNLTVLGDLVSLNVATLAIEDPLIVLAKDQSNTTTYTDAVDIGFFGTYGNTQVGNNKFTGLFRDQSDAGIYKLFDGAIPAPTTTVDTANVNFGYATLQGYLRTGGTGATGMIANATHIAVTGNSTLNVSITGNSLIVANATVTAFVANSANVNIFGAITANSTAANVVANSTYSVAIVANTLSLSTALPATSGGTGLNSYTSGDILVANTGNALSKLALGGSGFVLQSNGTAVVYDTLDGGTF